MYQAMLVCAAPKGRVFAPLGPENGYRLCPGVWNRVGFSKELRERMNVFIVSIPNEQERNRNVPIRNAFEEIFCLRSNISNHDIISA